MGDFKSSFLIAMPQLGDPNFARSIVLMLQHNEEGALGLVINDSTALDLGTFARNNQFPCHADISSVPVYRGGPVEPAVGWLLHQEASLEEHREIVSGLFMSGSQDSLRQLLETGSKPIKLILGYAGWGGGQLEKEMAEGAWISTEPGIEHILHTDADQMWKAVLADMGIDPSQLVSGGGLH